MSKSSDWDIERALDAMQASGLSRRTLDEAQGGAGALSLGLVGFLAACGDDDGGGGRARRR